MRWRLRGAWMWPSFVAITLLDGFLLHQLPPVRTGVDLIPGILLATFANLILIGAVGPWLARRLWKRRPAADPPAPAKAQFEVLSDRIGTGLLVASVLGVLAAGLAARPVVVSETEDTERAAFALLHRIERSGNEELIRNRDTAQTARLSDDFFRTCIRRDDERRYFCFLIDTSGKRVADRPRSERGAQPDRPLARTARRAIRRRGPRAAPRSCGRSRSDEPGTMREKNSRACPRRRKLSPTAATRPLSTSARSRTSPAAPPSMCPATRVGSSEAVRSTSSRRAVLATRARSAARPRRTAARHAPAQQILVGPDAVGRGPGIAERPAALGARAELGRPPPAHLLAGRLELLAPDGHHPAEVAPLHRHLLTVARLVGEGRIAVVAPVDLGVRAPRRSWARRRWCARGCRPPRPRSARAVLTKKGTGATSSTVPSVTSRRLADSRSNE